MALPGDNSESKTIGELGAVTIYPINGVESVGELNATKSNTDGLASLGELNATKSNPDGLASLGELEIAQVYNTIHPKRRRHRIKSTVPYFPLGKLASVINRP